MTQDRVTKDTPGEALPPCYTCPYNKTDAWGADSCAKNIIPHVGGGGINEAKMRIHMVTCDRETRATVDGYGEIYKK